MVIFKESKIAPNPKEIKYWIDLSEDPNGSVIKYYNGTNWVRANIGNTSGNVVYFEEIK